MLSDKDPYLSLEVPAVLFRSNWDSNSEVALCSLISIQNGSTGGSAARDTVLGGLTLSSTKNCSRTDTGLGGPSSTV